MPSYDGHDKLLNQAGHIQSQDISKNVYTHCGMSHSMETSDPVNPRRLPLSRLLLHNGIRANQNACETTKQRPAAFFLRGQAEET